MGGYAQSCLTLCDPMDCKSSSVHGVFQARILEWVAISFSRDLPNPEIEPASFVSKLLEKAVSFTLSFNPCTPA